MLYVQPTQHIGLNHFIIVMGRSLEKLDLGQIYNHHLDLRHDPSIDLGQSDLQTPHELCQDDIHVHVHICDTLTQNGEV